MSATVLRTRAFDSATCALRTVRYCVLTSAATRRERREGSYNRVQVQVEEGGVNRTWSDRKGTMLPIMLHAPYKSSGTARRTGIVLCVPYAMSGTGGCRRAVPP
eukprot:418685-Rhodomonas_salina.3